MIRPDQIPDEAAAALLEADPEIYTAKEIVAIVLNAWPGRYLHRDPLLWPPVIRLSLPQETDNA